MSSTRANPRRAGFFLNVMPAIVYVAAIFYAGSVEDQSSMNLQFALRDKLLHFLAFLGMQMTMFRAVRWERAAFGTRRQLLLALAITSAIGAGLEAWQALLPHRTAELFDWLADSLGAAVGAGLLWLIHGRAEEQRDY